MAVSEHLFMSIHLLFLLILKNYHNHIIMGILFSSPIARSLPKLLTRLPFFPVFVLTVVLVACSVL